MYLDDTSKEIICIEVLNANNIMQLMFTGDTLGKQWIHNCLIAIGNLVNTNDPKNQIIEELHHAAYFADTMILENKVNPYQHKLFTEHLTNIATIVDSPTSYIEES